MLTTKWQLFRFTLIYLSSQVTVFLIPILMSSSSYQGWIALVAGFGLSLIVLMFTIHLGALRPNQAWVDFGKDIFGKWIHRAMLLLLLCWCIYFTSFDIENFVLFFGTNYLRDTPPLFIQCVLGLVIMYTARLGFSTIVYMSDGIFLIFCVATIFSLYLLLPNTDLDMLPALVHYHNPRIAIKDSIMVTSWFAEWVVFLFVAPDLKIEAKILKKLMLAASCVLLIVFTSWLLTLLSFGPHLGKELYYPLIDMVRSSYQDNLLSNIDPLLIGVWSSSMLIHSSFLIYVAFKCLSSLTKERGKNYIIPFLTSIAVGIAYIYSRNIADYFIHYTSYTLVIIWLVVECIPIYYSLAAFIRFRKRAK
ncbi:MAG: GerAB/ArcD/ProY family transporter [Paenibacillus sp.]|nr:GerAB/ArcD/ProY family transporter [Paenibacillus sp.]